MDQNTTPGTTLDLSETRVIWNEAEETLIFRSVKSDCPDQQISGQEVGQLYHFLETNARAKVLAR